MGQARKNAAAECAQGSLLKACALPSIGFLCAAVGILLGGLMIPAVAGAQSLDYVDFGQPPGEIGFFDTNVSGINSSGDITGYFLDNARDYHSFVVAGGAFHSIGFPGTISTTVLAINDSEQMAGYFYGADNRYHGFLLSGIGGTYTPIDAPGAVHGTYATAMNNLGQVVGYYEDASFQYHGFLFSEGTITTFSPGAPGFFSGTVAINNAGQILGTFNDAPPTRQRAGRHRWLAGGRPRTSGQLRATRLGSGTGRTYTRRFR